MRRLAERIALACSLALIGWVIGGGPTLARSSGMPAALVAPEWLEKDIDAQKLRLVEVSVDPGL